MLSEQAALERVLTMVTPLSPTLQPLTSTLLGSYAGRQEHAKVPLPGFDNSSMDGYAVNAADTRASTPLPVIAEQPAGPTRNLTLSAGTAIRIFTGAPVPEGADAVIMQEDVDVHPSPSGPHIVCREPVEPGENIRRAGSDLCLGQKLIEAGTLLTPTLLGVLASQGLQDVLVHPTAKVAIVTTGDELVPAGRPLQPGQLYNSNGLMLESLVRQVGATHVQSQHLPDDLTVTTAALDELIAAHDFVILSGGVSVGDHDCIKPALQALGHPAEFWRVKVKPGKPLLFVQAQRPDGGVCHIFGLPGNPVSSFVTFMLFVRPALLKAMGATGKSLVLPTISATLASPLSNAGDRPHYVRGFYENGQFTPQGIQQSHALFGLSRANALLRMEADEVLNEGDSVGQVLLVS
jgi:molybdopterin molybdotransferase